ncbi:hypothetical protein CRG98_015960 [Punica granatum]|uniref:Major facilitator superfamily (MFS) profile domain-containing protein n=1 Tax=Punica granatum TaxID=22663 RepID=A0A2I0K532_PUNGR|nr:hypothetical protein CRG98_015960 [Punica granatum]
MFLGGLSFLIGAMLNGIAMNIIVLIIGRILLGVGVGFANQSVPVYLSEMAPAKIRGALNIGFQVAITIGILIANFVNYGTAEIKGGWGWRISLALAGVPALFMTIGSIFLPDTPNSIIERGHHEEAKRMLQKIRGTEDVKAELGDLIAASEAAKKVQQPWRNMFLPRYRPQLVICSLIPFFQQITGINVIMFYAPVLFKTLGFGDKASLMSAAITGGVQMIICQAINVSVNMFFTFIIAQGFLSMLCHIKFGLFFFFGGFVILMTIFVFFFLPETKNVPIEEMNRLMKAHWFWGKYIPDEVASGDKYTA